jgi:S-DNA-T family DNA segregation ATPase FtsK/SpoIIIE
MIDPKRLELGMYEDIPHLLTPVVVDPKQASNALQWAVREMEQRYKTLASEGVRNIDQFNRNVRLLMQERKAGGTDEDDRELKPLPFIVLVIDELADLMMVAGNDVEESIARLAQMARAVGIHLILATQRPSVDVLTGLIKANFPSRISFRVAARVDSRTILDSIGAEHLLGKGDMLFLPPGSARLTRIHGAYVSEQEIARLTSYLRKTGKPAYDESVGKTERTADTAEAFDRDELFDEAARFILQSGQASTSMLQRRFRIGFSRAGRLIDLMERDGIIGPADGSKPREILVAPDYYETVDAWPK